MDEVLSMFSGIRFKGYKSFLQDNYTDIPRLSNINLFIGKNNSGKTSILDVIGSSCDSRAYKELAIKPALVQHGYTISESGLNSYFKSYAVNWSTQRAMTQYIGNTIWLDMVVRNGYSGDSVMLEHEYDSKANSEIQDRNINWGNYKRQIPRENFRYVKIAAERNIIPERASNAVKLLPDGRGATNVIRNIINNSRFDERIIEEKLLNALNTIMGSDAHFTGIRVQELSGAKDAAEVLWEVYLQEETGRYPLSQSGSGLKTIILVLLNLIVLPLIEGTDNRIYGFEELENNLHPALQRRLYEYIYNYANEHQCYIFLTTHSHVAINMLYGKKNTTLYHVTKEGRFSSVKQIESYLDKVEILEDLDVKASDLLQANGIIWVEGPSDRVYIKKWLEVFGGNDIQEGRDYQFAYYGGRLLSHYSAEEDAKELINILLINRNSAILIDSDKRNRSTPINDTKKRIVKEFGEKHLFSWVTKGKEIENYLSYLSINIALDLGLQKQCGKYESFPEYIQDKYKNFSSKKVEFASKVKDSIDNTVVLDLDIQIKRLYETIKTWNK